MFKAHTIDDLTLEQWNVLIAFWNYKTGSRMSKERPRTVSIVTVKGDNSNNYGDD